MTKKICFDLDNVICFTNKKKEYKKSRPNKNAIKVVNSLYDEGYFIKIYTARGMGKYSENISKVKKAYKKLTSNQLKKWKVKYHQLILGKTSYDYFVDDKAYGFKKNWMKDIKSKIKKL